jgi:tetratricopeptide (TPR) repeat protein
MKRHIVAGWAFFAVGLVLIYVPCASVDEFFHFRTLSLALFPHNFVFQAFFMAFSLFGLLAADALCFITAWGVGHQRSWSRSTGLWPCVYMLLAFPYLTAFGVVGLYYLLSQPVVKRGRLTGTEFWNPRRQSGWMVIASLIGWFLAKGAFAGLQIRALSAGLSPLDSASPSLIVFLLLVWLQVAVHEGGHALAAVLVGFRVKVLGIGPLVLSKESGGLRLRFEWQRLLLLGGYVGAMPLNPRRCREKQMIVVAAGPVTSLLASATLYCISNLLPGTSLSHLWPLAAMGSMLGLFMGVVNLLPFGYCDGTMFFHLLFRTQRGQELISLILHRTNSPTQQPVLNPEDSVRRHAERLRELLNSPDPDPIPLGNTHIVLGCAEIGVQRWRDAEKHLTEGLALLPGGPSPRYQAAGWEGLAMLRSSRFDSAGVAEAHERGVAALRLAERDSQSADERLNAAVAAVRLHGLAHNWSAVLETSAVALAECPEDAPRRTMRGVLLGCRGHALLQTGDLETGLQAIEQSAAIFREQNGDIAAPQYLGHFGYCLWEAGRTEEAIALLTECVVMFEAGGAPGLAASQRLLLAEILRYTGKYAQAACVLPRFEHVTLDLRQYYYDRRGSIRRSAGYLPEAIADFSKVAGIAEADGEEVPLAIARTKLADALIHNGDLERAERLAGEARRVLSEAGHPDLGCACIVLAAIAARKGEPHEHQVEAAMRAWEAAALFLPADKARELEEAARSLDAVGLSTGSAACREAAKRYWRLLTPRSEVPVDPVTDYDTAVLPIQRLAET